MLWRNTTATVAVACRHRRRCSSIAIIAHIIVWPPGLCVRGHCSVAARRTRDKCSSITFCPSGYIHCQRAVHYKLQQLQPAIRHPCNPPIPCPCSDTHISLYRSPNGRQRCSVLAFIGKFSKHKRARLRLRLLVAIRYQRCGACRCSLPRSSRSTAMPPFLAAHLLQKCIRRLKFACGSGVTDKVFFFLVRRICEHVMGG